MKYSFDKKEHLHTFDGKPLTGTSTVMSVISKPLTWWASGKAVECLGWTKPDYEKKNGYPVKVDGKLIVKNEKERFEKASEALEIIKTMDTEIYLELLDRAYKNHKESLDSSADKGTDLHTELEGYVKKCLENEGKVGTFQGTARAFPFVEWARKNVKKFLWSEMHCFDEVLWIGGICDCGVELNDGNIGVVDFKSAKEAYNTHFFQIAGYDLQITKNGGYTSDGEKIFTLEKPITKHIVVPFGAKEPYVVSLDTVEEHKEAFKAALTLYRIMNKLNN